VGHRAGGAISASRSASARFNDLGFSWEEVETGPPRREASSLRLRTFVADRKLPPRPAAESDGIEAEESQARQSVNEIREQQATLAQRANRSVALSAAA